nr:paired amphipathic helix protein Sin3-like 2 isoform X3 [Tanacetum cinerariifolium]
MNGGLKRRSDKGESLRNWHGRDATPRPRNVHNDGHEAKLNIDDVSSSKGELSPNVYFDEADLAAYGNHNGSNAKAKHSMEIDADADEEENKNVLEGGDDMSGSESTADECSREDHEDGDRDDLDGKADSEGEVKSWLDSEEDIRLWDWKAAEIEILNVFQLLTAKPVICLNGNERWQIRLNNLL